MKKVLIIDDEVDLCIMIKQFLSRKNYDVHIAHTLTDGFSYLNMINPHALILDNNLPDGMGWDAVGIIHERFPEMKITLISAHKTIGFFHPALSAQIKILEKPISLREIEMLL